jgi:hypothetical protein
LPLPEGSLKTGTSARRAATCEIGITGLASASSGASSISSACSAGVQPFFRSSPATSLPLQY